MDINNRTYATIIIGMKAQYQKCIDALSLQRTYKDRIVQRTAFQCHTGRYAILKTRNTVIGCIL